MDDAFGLLRSHARAHNQRLGDLARAVVERTTTAGALLNRSGPAPSTRQAANRNLSRSDDQRLRLIRGADIAPSVD